MASSIPKIVYGATDVAAFSTEELDKRVALLEHHNVKILDTAHVYVRDRRDAFVRPHKLMMTAAWQRGHVRPA